MKVEIREYLGPANFPSNKGTTFRTLAVFRVYDFEVVQNFEPRSCDGSCNDGRKVLKHEHEISMVFSQ